MQLINLVFRERPGYQDMPLRPYAANATGSLIDRLREDTNDGRDLTPAAISRTAGKIIRPQSNVDGDAIIAGGWGEKRFMFLATVLVRDTRTARSTLEISGYTDHVGAVETLRGIKLDPDMCLYFNSVTEMNQAYFNTPSGGDGWRTSIASSNHIIGPQQLPDFTMGTSGTMTMRPEDVFRVPPTTVLQNSFNRQVREESSFQDMRNTVTNRQPRLSSRLNDSSTRYLHRSIKALSTANQGIDYGSPFDLDRDPSELLKDARDQVRERTLSSIPIFADMARDTRILDQGFVTLGELQAMNEDFAWDDVKVFFLDPATVRSYSDTTGWNGRDNTSIAAIQIARALPTYMTLHQIVYIEFDANNMSYAGEPTIMIPNALPMLGKSLSPAVLDSFEQRLITELFVDMLPWDDCMFDIRVKASLGSDITIDIQLAGEDPAEFVFPVFCDSLVAPVVVNHNDRIENMGSTLTSIVDQLGSDYADDYDTPTGSGTFASSDVGF